MSPFKILIVVLIVAVLVLVATGLFGPYLAARRIIRPEIGTTLTVPAFAYAPSLYQTDATPCITASGTRVRRGTVAANFLPMGTILDMAGEKLIVEDRMHPRYNRAIDIFRPSTSEAREYGRQTVEITIIEYGEPGQELSQTGNTGAGETPGVKEAPVEKADEPTIFNRLRGRLNYLSRLLKAGTPADVNRYDVNCFEE